MTDFDYVNLKTRERVNREDAEAYVLKQCGILLVDDEAPFYQNFIEDTIEWFFSGNWTKEPAV